MELQNTLDKLVVVPTLPPPCPPTLLLIMHERCINLTLCLLLQSRGSFLSISTARLQRSLEQVRHSERHPRAYFFHILGKTNVHFD